MIIFKKIRYKNFFSTGDQFTEIELNKNSATLVFGTNGTGKSTILDALTWSLFGKPYRNINIPQLTNSINGSDMMVEIEFSINKKNYLIRRGMKPRIFEIYENKKLEKQDAKRPDYQRYLESTILKLNYRSFCQVVVLGSSTFVPFMRLPAAERRFIIENLLDIRIFSAMNVLLKQKVVTLKDTLNQTEYDSELINEKVSLQEKYLKNLQKDNRNKIVESKKTIQDNKKKRTDIVLQIKKIRTEISKLIKSNSNLDESKKKISKMEALQEQIEKNIERSENSIEFYTQTENCPTCEQNIDDSFKDKMIQKKQMKAKKLQEGLLELNQDIEKAQKKLDALIKSSEDIKQREKVIQKLNSEINGINNYITKVQEEIQSLLDKKTKDTDGEKRITELRKEQQELVKKKETLLEERHDLEIVSMMLKDSGIKAKIIQQYLPIINKHVNKYLTDLDFFVNFNLDETFKESIKSRGRDEFSYESFSEGEKLRIDLALLFTFRDIAKLKNSANTNILIMDEILDRSLDSIGIDEFLKLMNELWHGLNIFIISPRGEIFVDKFPNSIRFKKQNNFSVMVQE